MLRYPLLAAITIAVAGTVVFLPCAQAKAAAESRPVLIEGESLTGTARSTQGRVTPQNMSGFGRAWSGNAQLSWVPPQAGHQLYLSVPVPATGQYEVAVYYTRANNCGDFVVFVGRKQLGGTQRSYSAKVVQSGRVVLGRTALQRGNNKFVITGTGKDVRSIGWVVGLDKIELVAMTPAAGKPNLTVRAPERARPNSSGKSAKVTLNRGVLRQPIRRPLDTVRPYPVTYRAIAPGKLYLPAVDLRPTIKKENLRVRAQGNRGTCSIFAVTFLHEYMYNTRTDKHFNDLSEEYLNYVTNFATGRADDGDFFENIDVGYQKYGAYPEGLVPYQDTFDLNFKPPLEYLEIGSKWPKFRADFIRPNDGGMGASTAHLQRTVDYLKKSIPVAIGIRFPRAGQFKTTTVHGVEVMANLPAEEPLAGKLPGRGHSVVLVGYLESPSFPGGGYFIFRNSWGDGDKTKPGFWDKGYGVMTFEYVQKFTNDLIAYH